MPVMSEAELIGKYAIDNDGLAETSPQEVLSWAHQAFERAERAESATPPATPDRPKAPTLDQVKEKWIETRTGSDDDDEFRMGHQLAIEFTYTQLARYIRG